MIKWFILAGAFIAMYLDGWDGYSGNFLPRVTFVLTLLFGILWFMGY